ncbi:hypothetical protein Cantr_06688 [Candida viswanathii]|uniref:Uncharacterized protein n=1 Tax=Candida viswanathii TaxID=5486 RepID=A0A367XXJ9_9ASCO|nr:hypothetical protein Cantr_06688 [Candida viswanathii]
MEKLSRRFVDILDHSKDHDFVNYRYVSTPSEPEVNTEAITPAKFMPSVPEAVAHLKLLKAFEVMKNKLVPDLDGEEFDKHREKLWQCLVTIAVRRFIVFVSALKRNGAGDYQLKHFEVNTFAEANVKDSKFIGMMNRLMPPLDVIMVWHAFLLHPRTVYDTCMRNHILRFANYPFPLQRISQFIDNETFEFNVPAEYQKNYLALLNTFEKVDHTFEFELAHSYRGGGFAGPNFQTKNLAYKPGIIEGWFFSKPQDACVCAMNPLLTHEELRRIHLRSDVYLPVPMPGIFTHFSDVLISSTVAGRYPGDASGIVTFSVRNAPTHTDLTKFIDSIEFDDRINARLTRLILRNYLQFNYVSLTVRYGVLIGEDLVGCVFRQERFAQTMNKLDWLHSPLIREALDESILRYQRFFKMVTEELRLKPIYVPCLDIDLIWHTHQLSMYGYIRDCKTSECHTVIDHDDKIDELKLDDSFGDTCKRYKKMFKEDYSICYCLYCTNYRAAARKSLLSSIFSSSSKRDKEDTLMKQSPLFTPDEGVTHISAHQGIKLPTKKATKLRSKNEEFSWGHNHPTHEFVVVPYAPIEEEHCSLYKNGTCTTVRILNSGIYGCVIPNGAPCGSDS